MFAKKNTQNFNFFLEDLRPASAAQAHLIAKTSSASNPQNNGGYLSFGLETPSSELQSDLHSFSWLRHFSAGVANGEGDMANLARHYVNAWVNEKNWDKQAWTLPIVAARVISWLANGKILTSNVEDYAWQQKMRRVLISHGKFLLKRANSSRGNAEGKLSAGAAIILLGLCLNGYDHWIEIGFDILMREAAEQILPDGGHISRNPSEHLTILFDLLMLKKSLLSQGRPGPTKLPAIIDRMLPMLRFFSHGDGRLALFNGAREEEKDLLAAALANDDSRGKPFAFAPHSGYQRVVSGQSLLLMDSGAPPPGQFSQKAHAGCLSMEMSSGKQRFIVNCGAVDNQNEAWRIAGRSTAAHSTLTVKNTSSARQGWGGGAFGKRLGGLSQVDSRREKSDQGVLLDSGHDGYVQGFGLVHRRKLFLTNTGKKLLGEDLLQLSGRRKKNSAGAKNPVPFTIRFHFHPDVRCALTQDGNELIARLSNGEGWRFRAQAQTVAGSAVSKCTLQKQPSIYLGGGKPRRTEQLMLEAQTMPSDDAETIAKVNWMWQRI